MILLLSADKTTDVYRTDKYEHELIPKKKLLDNFNSIDFSELLKYDIEEIFIFNSRNTVLSREDYYSEFVKEYGENSDKKEDKLYGLVKTVNILNRNRFHLINRKQDFINIIRNKNIILLENYLDEFLTYLIHSKYSLINELLFLDVKLTPIESGKKDLLKKVWDFIQNRDDFDKSKDLIDRYFQKYLIDFISDDHYLQFIDQMMNMKSNNSPYYVWGKDYELVYSLMAKVYNSFYDDKEHIELSNSLEFRIPFSKNIFLQINDKIDGIELVKRLEGELFNNKRVFIFNFSEINYPEFEKYKPLYIPKLSELDNIYSHFFTYFLIISNSNDYDLVKFLIDLEGYPDFFNEIKSFPQLGDIKKFVTSFELESKNLKTVTAIKNQIREHYKQKINTSINKIEWYGSKLKIKFIDYDYIIESNARAMILVHLLKNPGTWKPIDLYSIISIKKSKPKDILDTLRKSYDNLLFDLDKYEEEHQFKVNTLTNYLRVNDLIKFLSKDRPVVTSKKGPAKWQIEV
jgi:hypothetical protein